MSDQEALDPLRRIRCVEADVHRRVTEAAGVAVQAVKAAQQLTRDDVVLSGPTTDDTETTEENT